MPELVDGRLTFPADTPKEERIQLALEILESEAFSDGYRISPAPERRLQPLPLIAGGLV
jgi:hypothetical protein